LVFTKANFYQTKMSFSHFRKKTLLESWKFGVYLAIPFIAVYVIAAPENMRSLLQYKQYVVYPPEGPRPPVGTREEVLKGVKELREQQKQARMQAQTSGNGAVSNDH
jgi:protein PET100